VTLWLSAAGPSPRRRVRAAGDKEQSTRRRQICTRESLSRAVLIEERDTMTTDPAQRTGHRSRPSTGEAQRQMLQGQTYFGQQDQRKSRNCVRRGMGVVNGTLARRSRHRPGMAVQPGNVVPRTAAGKAPPLAKAVDWDCARNNRQHDTVRTHPPFTLIPPSKFATFPPRSG